MTLLRENGPIGSPSSHREDPREEVSNSSDINESRQTRCGSGKNTRKLQKTLSKQNPYLRYPARKTSPRSPRISSSPVWTPGKHGVPATGGITSKNLRRRRFRPPQRFRSPRPATVAPPCLAFHRSASKHSFSLHRYLRFSSRKTPVGPHP